MRDHTDAGDDADLYSQATWDARYAGSDRIWSGNPNPRLVEHAAGLTPGEALDVGAGEGADAVWLASQGWNVTALDISRVALDRTAAHAEESGVAARVRTLHHDLIRDPAVPGAYDLVSAQFWHPPAELLVATYEALGAAVRSGGRLLVVAHHPADLAAGLRTGHGHPERLFTPEAVVAALPQEDWVIEVCDAPTRLVPGHDGPVTDTVVLALRR